MNIQDLEHRFINVPGKEKAYILLHGISEGMNSEFIQSIVAALDGESVFTLTLPYLTRNEEPSEGLVEEREILQSVIEYLHQQGCSQFVIIGKSLGAIVASRWLQQYPNNLEVKVHILGYVIGDVATDALKDHLGVVIQGEHDRFGNAAAVEAELKKHGVSGKVLEVPHADHSYRNPSREPVHQQQAIKLLFENIL